MYNGYLDGVSIDIVDVFQRACYCGQLLIAQWLYEVGDVHIPATIVEACQSACNQGHLLVANWLYDIDEISVEILQVC